MIQFCRCWQQLNWFWYVWLCVSWTGRTGKCSAKAAGVAEAAVILLMLVSRERKGPATTREEKRREGEKKQEQNFLFLFTEAYLLFQMETRPFFLLLFLLVLRVSLSRFPFLNHSIRGKGFPVTLHLSRSLPFDLTLKSAFRESRRKFLIPNFPLFAVSS